MNVEPTVVIDPRDAKDIEGELDARRPGYVRGWSPTPQDPADALERIAARYAQAIIQRLNQAPAKNELAFLDLLGQRLAAARAARAPIVFRLSQQSSQGTATAGTAVAAAPPPGQSQQVVFETERDLGLTPGKLVQVFSLWPGRDEYIDHSAQLAARQPMQLFSADLLDQVPHVLYLAHDALLKLTGNVELQVELQLDRPGSDPLQIAWEYWDGQVWRGFALVTRGCAEPGAELTDGTSGLTSGGVVTLRAAGAVSEKIAINGVSAHWLRARLTQALPPDPARALPEVDGIRLSSIVSQPLLGRLSARLDADAGSPRSMQGTLLDDAGQPIAGAVVLLRGADGSGGLEPVSDTTDLDGAFTLRVDGQTAAQSLRFEVSHLDIQARSVVTLPGSSAGVDGIVPAVALTLAVVGTVLDKAFNDGTKLDTTKPFYPFGQSPQPGTTFYFSSAAVFAKPGASVRLYLPRTSAPSDRFGGQDRSSLNPIVRWEYWNGVEWASLLLTSPTRVKGTFEETEIVEFRVPLDLVPTTVNEEEAPWMRARLASGGFGIVQKLSIVFAPESSVPFDVVIPKPPVVAAARLGFSWQFGPFHPERVLSFNDFAYRDRTYEATWPGATFLPYERMADVTPAVYLGFDAKAPVASIGLFIDVLERPSDVARPRFIWEYWDGFEWFALSVDDETADLTAPGILSYLAESDSTALPRFGSALHWLRARLTEDGPPPVVDLLAVYPNAVWARQQRTFTDVLLGTANGTPSEIFRITQTPVLPGQELEVMERSGARANVEWRIVALDLCGGDDQRVRDLERALSKEGPAGDVIDGALRLHRDKDKRVVEVWVRWEPQPTLSFSGPADRHYAIDAARGIVFFGDGTTGRTLPQGARVSARRFKSGGGAGGNVPASTIQQLLGALSGVEEVFNPHAAEGGCDGESLDSFRRRAPASVRHRGRALSVGDYEAMVREASSAVAVVKVLPSRNAAGRELPGYLTILIVPSSQAPRPYPTRGMRDEVLRYLETRTPAGLIASGRVYVTGPTYHSVDVAATLVPRRDDEAGSVEARVREALERFLHPLEGGPDGSGWEFGRGVHRSDIARVIEGVDGVDHAESIQLLVNDQVRGEAVNVPPHEIVAAGKLRLRLRQGARS